MAGRLTNLCEKTLVVFMSDNGGATNNASWNSELTGAKGSLRFFSKIAI